MHFYEEDLLKLALALLLGGVVGLEREYRGKAAGFRTMIMICVGATLFTMISLRIHGAGDRIAANIVNGIGFLGAGIIYKEDNRVRGLTTAAAVWAVSALGMAIGAGDYDLSFMGFGLILIALLLLSRLSEYIALQSQNREYKIVTDHADKTLSDFEQLFKECGLRSQRGPQQRIGTEMTGRWHVKGSQKDHEKCMKQLLADPAIKELTF